MMSIQLRIWKLLATNQTPLCSHHVSKAMSLLPPLAIYAQPHFKFPNFCTETAVRSTTPSEKGVVTEFLLNKCSLTEEEIAKTYKSCSHLLRWKSNQNCEEVLELLNGCGLTTPAQIRKVTLCQPTVFFRRNIKSKLSFLRTFMKVEDIAHLLYRNARFITYGENSLKSAVSLLRKLGLDGKAVSKLLARKPRVLTATGEDVMDSFKIAEDLGFKKGSKMFPHALEGILSVGKEGLDRRRLFFGSLGFSEKQISDILKRQPSVLWLSEEKVKRNVDFLVNSAGLPLDDLVKYPIMFAYSLEKRMIPRYRLVKALESMQLTETKISLGGFAKLSILSERIFVEKYINSNAESSLLLLDIYHGRKVDD